MLDEALAPYRWVAESLIGFKTDVVGSPPTKWALADFEDVLLGYYPAKHVAAEDLHDEVINGAAAFIRFLRDEGHLQASEAATLEHEVLAMRAGYKAAMSNPENWSMGKRINNHLLSNGVHLSDPDELAAGMDALNTLSFEERGVIMGIDDDAPRGGQLAMLTELVRERERLTLTDRGNFKMADARELVSLLGTADELDPVYGQHTTATRSSADLRQLDLLLRVAVESELLERQGKRGTKLVIGFAAQELPSPEQLALLAFEALTFEAGPITHMVGDNDRGFRPHASLLDSAWPALLATLADADRSIEEFAERFWALMDTQFDLARASERQLEFLQSTLRHDMRYGLEVFERLGAVEIRGVTEILEYGRPARSGGTAALTALGRFLVGSFVAGDEFAPATGQFSDATATELCAILPELPSEMALIEVDSWAAHRLAQRPGFSLHAAVLLTQWGAVSPAELDCQGEVEQFVATMSAAIEVVGHEVAVGDVLRTIIGNAAPEKLIEKSWRSEHPYIVEVLAAIAECATEKRLAKAARKALFRHNSRSS